MRPTLNWRAGLLLAGLALIAAPAHAQLSGTVGKPKEEAPKPAATPRPKPRPRPAAAPPKFGLEIEQDGVSVPVTDHEVYLRRAPFAILLHSPDQKGALLSARFEPELYDLARGGGDFGPAFRRDITVADSAANADQTLYLGADSLQRLSLENKSFTGMDHVTPAGPGFRGRRTVARLFIADQAHDITSLPPRPIHLVAARGSVNDATGLIDVAQFEYVKVYFDTVPAALREKVDGQMKTVLDSKKPFAERTAALQELAKSPRDTIRAIDATLAETARNTTGDAAKAAIREFVSAERAYAGANGGLYDKPECLLSPLSCHPKTRTPTPFLNAPAEGERHGYTFTFHQGLPATKDEIKKAKGSPSSMKGFAFTAVPLPGTGGASFCGDDTGRLCSEASGVEIETEAGRCPASCAAVP
jgi:hypothetical protein